MNDLASALFVGEVVHQRFKPRRHRLSYRVFSLLADLEELPAIADRLRLLSYNRWGILSFYERDHGDDTGGSLRAWLDRQLAQAGIDLGGGPVRVLCYPRMFGYVFNPLSVFFCHRASGSL
ncbi:MAG: DUF1365 family protein, partial [Rhodospirillales bacterium]|nr:DUF1365 family protein [Rhodospirillales bacterium]